MATIKMKVYPHIHQTLINFNIEISKNMSTHLLTTVVHKYGEANYLGAMYVNKIILWSYTQFLKACLNACLVKERL